MLFYSHLSTCVCVCVYFFNKDHPLPDGLMWFATGFLEIWKSVPIERLDRQPVKQIQMQFFRVYPGQPLKLTKEQIFLSSATNRANSDPSPCVLNVWSPAGQHHSGLCAVQEGLWGVGGAGNDINAQIWHGAHGVTHSLWDSLTCSQVCVQRECDFKFLTNKNRP